MIDRLQPPTFRTGCLFFFAIPFSLFCGMMVATAGGAVYPPVLGIASPIVCSGGTMSGESQYYSYKPGQSGIARSWHCEREGEPKVEVTAKAMATAFGLYTLIAFALTWFLLVPILRRRAQKGWAKLMAMSDAQKRGMASGYGDGGAFGGDSSGGSGGPRIIIKTATMGGDDASDSVDWGTPSAHTPDAAERLAQLSALRDKGLITAAEYDAKRAEILKEL